MSFADPYSRTLRISRSETPSHTRPPAALTRFSQRAIVDQRVADTLDASDRPQGLASDQHAATRRACAPRRRIQLEEKENEGGNQQFLRPRLAPQTNHYAHQIVTLGRLGEEST